MAYHVHDTSVLERRLRPIYDSLESGNTKKALQETEKVLKKNPKLQCGRALKALSLLRLGKEKEGEHLILELENEKPSDDLTLQVMTFYYRETDQLDKICKIYADAVKATPGNEETLSHLFMSYVRVNDYKNQQTVALQLYKLKPKNPYYFWAVMSVVLQALRGNDKSKKGILLALAQRMIDKLINEDKLDAAQEIQLYLNILKYQEKFKEALEFLDNPICVKLFSVPVADRIDLMKKVDKCAELNILLKELLRENLDRWDYYKEYIESSITLMKKQDKTEGVDSSIEQCHTFLQELIKKGDNKVRGPHLGYLQLHRRMFENNVDPNPLLGDFVELLVEYFKFFGDKPCCSHDLKIFIDYLGPTKSVSLASKLLQDCGISSTTLPQSKEQMQKHICSLQISRLCGAHAALTSEHLSALSTALTLHYEHGMNAFGTNLLTTDIGPSDPYALLAVYVMYDEAMRQNSSEKLVEALCLLQYLLGNSPSNFHAKLLCLQIYHILGCGWGAVKTYESLEIKHIQLDSMGYLHCARLPSIGLAVITKNLYETTLKFFTTSYKDSVEFLAMSYKYGSFSILEEFMDFRSTLSNSLHYSLIAVEIILVDILYFDEVHTQNMNEFKNMDINPSLDRINWDELTDNRDLSVIMKWDPPSEEEEKIKTESFQQDKELLKLRATMLKIIGASVEFINSYGTLEYENAKNLMLTLKDLWSSHFKHIREQNYIKIKQKYLVSLLPSRLHAMLNQPYEEFFTDLCEFILNLYGTENCPKNSFDKLIEITQKLVEIISTTIKKHNEAKDVIWERREVQECVVCCIEILSLGAFILNVAYEKIGTMLSSAQSKKSKKLKDAGHQIDSNHANPISDKGRQQMLGLLLKSFKLEFHKIETIIESWKTPVLSKDLAGMLASMSLNPQVEVEVNGIFRDDHIWVLRQLMLIVKDKIKMLTK